MYRDILNEKIANILVFLADKVDKLYLTKALKLLYLIDETATHETGSPITWLDYKLWKLGPVPESIYDDLNSLKNNKEKCNPLNGYIEVLDVLNPHENDNKCSIIEVKKGIKFNEMIFSDYEIELMSRIIEEKKDKSSSELVKDIHEEGTFYHELESNIPDLEEIFQLNDGKSNYSVEFSKLLKEEPLKKEVYKSTHSSLDFRKAIMNL